MSQKYTVLTGNPLNMGAMVTRDGVNFAVRVPEGREASLVLTDPSGNTVPASQVANTTEDLEVMQTGQEFEFPLNTREARYIRFRTMSTWGNVTYVEIPEIDFYGALHAEGE